MPRPILGTKTLTASGGYRCHRCGLDIGRPRPNSIGLCEACRSDKWYIDKIRGK